MITPNVLGWWFSPRPAHLSRYMSAHAQYETLTSSNASSIDSTTSANSVLLSAFIDISLQLDRELKWLAGVVLST